MLGGGAVRFCRVCRFNVYDLSQMTLDEATELVEESEGRLCGRFIRRADRTVVTDDRARALRGAAESHAPLAARRGSDDGGADDLRARRRRRAHRAAARLEDPSSRLDPRELVPDARHALGTQDADARRLVERAVPRAIDRRTMRAASIQAPARWQRPHRHAIKLLAAELARDETSVATLARLDHPNVVRLHGVGRTAAG